MSRIIWFIAGLPSPSAMETSPRSSGIRASTSTESSRVSATMSAVLTFWNEKVGPLAFMCFTESGESPVAARRR
jgi:hypothetical protein